MSMPRSGHQRAQAVLEGLRLVWQRVAGTIMTGPWAPRTARTKGAGMLRGFATVNYWTDDLAAATRWYAELLGVDPYFERPGPDGRPAYVEFRAAVVDPFGNILGVMYNPHYLEVLGSTGTP